jgi:FkbM family methyltransferase
LAGDLGAPANSAGPLRSQVRPQDRPARSREKPVLHRIKTTLKKVPLARRAYAQLRSWHDRRQGKTLFENYETYVSALYRKRDGGTVLRTHDGLAIGIRRNLWDARVVREIFFGKPYLRHVALPAAPVIVDIGGYIGDFSLYAVKYLNAARVIVYEPTAENFALLAANVARNGYAGRITAVNKAVGASREVALNVKVDTSEEVHVSAYLYDGAERRTLPGVTLAELLEAHGLESVDLLKVDCEGGEYDIFPDAPDEAFERIRNIAFEFHAVAGFEAKLARVLERLREAGYALLRERNIYSATRRH